ncbi:hypothetical protein SLOPH_2389 [Spraguea lophii 42_110]|uniref:Uncharacterized protein n=1 Tax=Spraguea lophii (strain 42_110) TaxID=1358809 RepID=S7W869_SPRLO|nr:hypothetical protein SLOPH_2389 [Spraguea lophii 42_110]
MNFLLFLIQSQAFYIYDTYKMTTSPDTQISSFVCAILIFISLCISVIGIRYKKPCLAILSTCILSIFTIHIFYAIKVKSFVFLSEILYYEDLKNVMENSIFLLILIMYSQYFILSSLFVLRKISFNILSLICMLFSIYRIFFIKYSFFYISVSIIFKWIIFSILSMLSIFLYIIHPSLMLSIMFSLIGITSGLILLDTQISHNLGMSSFIEALKIQEYKVSYIKEIIMMLLMIFVSLGIQISSKIKK